MQLFSQLKMKLKFAKALSGTVKSVMNNMIVGATKGFEKKLTILGVELPCASSR